MTNFNTEQMLIMRYGFNPLIPLDLVAADYLSSMNEDRYKKLAREGNLPLTNKVFISKSIKIHGNKYQYSKTKYANNSQKVTITCDVHGDFEQMPDSHMRGKGCPICGGINQGWSRTDFNNACVKNNNGFAVLYVIRCFNESEVFYKVGITSKSIRERFSGKKTMPYNYEVVHELLAEPSLVWDIESEILRGKYLDKYKPKMDFGGCTECLSNINGINAYLIGLV